MVYSIYIHTYISFFCPPFCKAFGMTDVTSTLKSQHVRSSFWSCQELTELKASLRNHAAEQREANVLLMVQKYS